MDVTDRVALLDTIARYTAWADRNDMDAYLDVFADDGTLKMYIPGQKQPIVDVTGREALRKAFLQVLANRGENAMKIHLGYPLLDPEVAACDVTVRTPFFGFWNRTQTDPPQLKLSGWYVDRWRKIDGQWRIVERREQPDSTRTDE